MKERESLSRREIDTEKGGWCGVKIKKEESISKRKRGGVLEWGVQAKREKGY